MLISHFNALQGHGTTLTGMVSLTFYPLFLEDRVLCTNNQLLFHFPFPELQKLFKVGTIDQKCDVLSVANDAYDAAAVIATQNIFK